MKNWKYYLGIPWVLFVVGAYYYYHEYYYVPQSAGYFEFYSNLGLFLGVYLLLYFGFLFVWNGDLKNKMTEFKVKPLYILAFILLNLMFIAGFRTWQLDASVYKGETLVSRGGQILEITDGEEILDNDKIMIEKDAFLFDTKKVLEGAPEAVLSKVKRSSYPMLFWNALMKFLFIFGVIYLIFSTIYILGSVFVDKFLHREKGLSEILYSFGFGFIGFMVYIFSFALFGFWNFHTALALILFPNLMFFKRTLRVIKNVLSYDIKLKFKSFSLSVLAFFSVLMIFSFNFITNLRSMPSGWDDLTRYVLLPKLIAQNGSLIHEFVPDNFGLIMSLGYVIFDSAMITMFISIVAGILALVAIYHILTKFTDEKMSFVLTCLFYTLPMIFFQSSAEIKTDMALLLFGALSFLSYLKYREGDSLRWLSVCALFAGTAFGIKFTALYLIFTLVVLLAYRYFKVLGALSVFLVTFATLFFANHTLTLYQFDPVLLKWMGFSLFIIGILVGILALIRSKQIKNGIKNIIIFSGIILITFAPWGLNNLYYSDTVSINRFLMGPGHYYSEIDWEKIGIDRKVCLDQGEKNWDFGRYLPPSDTPYLKVLLVPWTLTMNNGFVSPYVDVSHFFLAFIPILLILFYRKLDKEILLFSLVYWMYFWVSSSGVIWYGLIGFVPFLIIFAYLFKDEHPGFFKLIPRVLLVLWFVLIIALRVDFFNASYFYSTLSLGGVMTEDDSKKILDEIYKGQISTLDAIDWENLSNDKVYLNNQTLVFFVDHNHRNIVPDKRFDDLKCLFNDRENFVGNLKKIEIKYILFTEFEPNGFTQSFITFAKDNLILEKQVGISYLFAIN